MSRHRRCRYLNARGFPHSEKDEPMKITDTTTVRRTAGPPDPASGLEVVSKTENQQVVQECLQ